MVMHLLKVLTRGERVIALVSFFVMLNEGQGWLVLLQRRRMTPGENLGAIATLNKCTTHISTLCTLRKE